MKVICAGAPKTGTKSLARALRMLGYGTVYDAEESVEFAFKEWEEVWGGSQPDLQVLMETAYSDVDAVVDLPHSHFFDHFLEHWPNAKVILMLRDENDWFKSYKNMIHGAGEKYKYLVWFRYFSPALPRMLRWQMKLFECTTGGPTPHEFFWKAYYRRHNSFVRSTVPSEQLLEYRIEQGWDPLCKFLNKPVPEDDFPFENRAGISHNIADKMMQDTWIARKVARELTWLFSIISIVIVAVIAAYFFS